LFFENKDKIIKLFIPSPARETKKGTLRTELVQQGQYLPKVQNPVYRDINYAELGSGKSQSQFATLLSVFNIFLF